jgi:hypothetical protein
MWPRCWRDEFRDEVAQTPKHKPGFLKKPGLCFGHTLRLIKFMEHLIGLAQAHDAVISVIQRVPDLALDWCPREDEFTPKRIIAHLAHSNDFYVMIVEEARSIGFSVIRFHQGLPGWQRFMKTDTEAMQCISAQSLLDCFERAYQNMLQMLHGLSDVELDRNFIVDEARSDRPPVETTLRKRVIDTCAEHMNEHREQLINILALYERHLQTR